MEKSKPTHDLKRIKDLISKKGATKTTTAVRFAHELGFSGTDIEDVVLGLSIEDFQKSITEYTDPKSWQDVYRIKYRDLDMYVKLKIAKSNEDVIILSFKKYGEERRKP